MKRVLLIMIALLFTLSAFGATEIVSGKIVSADSEEVVIKLSNGVELTTVMNKKTRLWKDKKPAQPEDFTANLKVSARLKTEAGKTAELKEIADAKTWEWLNDARREVQKVSIVSIEEKTLTVRLEDDSEFTYRISDKTSVRLEGKKASIDDLSENQVVYIKPMTLSTLDALASEITDEKPKKSKKES